MPEPGEKQDHDAPEDMALLEVLQHQAASRAGLYGSKHKRP